MWKSKDVQWELNAHLTTPRFLWEYLKETYIYNLVKEKCKMTSQIYRGYSSYMDRNPRWIK